MTGEKPQMKSKFLTIILALTLITSLAFLTGCSDKDKAEDKDKPKTEQEEKKNEPKEETKEEPKGVTLSAYDKIELGMSYKTVTELLGGDGILQSEAGEKGSETYVSVYKWDGKTEKSYIIVVMRGDMITSKTQAGME